MLASAGSVARPRAGSDDGIQSGQTLRLDFGSKVTIKNFAAWDNGSPADHDGIVDYVQGDKFELSIDGGAAFEVSLSDLDANAAKDVNWVGTTFEISHVNRDFYWSTMTVDPVPEPGTLLLIGSGIAGIFAVRRRKITPRA